MISSSQTTCLTRHFVFDEGSGFLAMLQTIVRNINIVFTGSICTWCEQLLR